MVEVGVVEVVMLWVVVVMSDEKVEEGGKLYPRVGYFSWPAI